MTPTITVSLRLLSLSKGTINILLFGKPIFYYSEAVIETCAPYEIYATLINFAKHSGPLSEAPFSFENNFILISNTSYFDLKKNNSKIHIIFFKTVQYEESFENSS